MRTWKEQIRPLVKKANVSHGCKYADGHRSQKDERATQSIGRTCFVVKDRTSSLSECEVPHNPESKHVPQSRVQNVSHSQEYKRVPPSGVQVRVPHSRMQAYVPQSPVQKCSIVMNASVPHNQECKSVP